MAGAYPDVPGPRMAYDRDGTLGFHYVNGSATAAEFSVGELQAGNDEGTGSRLIAQTKAFYGSQGETLGFIFPELRDIVGIAIGASGSSGTIYISSNTTNGIDGTWTSTGVATTTVTTVSNVPSMRNNIYVVNWTGVKAVRFGWTRATDRWVHTVHLYGKPVAGAALDRLRFWDPTLDQEVGGAHFDWGDIARSSSVTRDFRVRNPSTLTAIGTSVTMEALTDTSPANVGQHEFSVDGGATWASSASLGDLGPGATSNVITLRRVTSGSAALSLWWTRMVASASSWA